ncbi:hypothetical protein HDF16_005322 [Granulicella aggregans]|uniref:Uncharacterized protein n=1 Tax=Granulicella aggregans TaxID=474949 RepID=A0A7W8E6E1_9BACT|nr:hypothetical protein [Granulicella aggregans]
MPTTLFSAHWWITSLSLPDHIHYEKLMLCNSPRIESLMRTRGLSSISAVFLTLALGMRGNGQEIYRLRDAPFTATQVWASKDRQNINKVARASDGSIYIASFDAQGSPQWVTIEDAPHRRVIVLQAKARVYTVTVRSPADPETYSLEQWTEVGTRLAIRVPVTLT